MKGGATPQDEIDATEDEADDFATDDADEEADLSDIVDTAEDAATLDDNETAYGIAAE